MIVLGNKVRNSILYALVLQVTVVCTIIGKFVNISNLSVLVSCILIMVTMFFNHRYLREQLLRNIFCFLTGMVLFGFSVIYGIDSQYYVSYFLFYLTFFFSAILVNILEIDYKILMEALIVISFISVMVFLIFESTDYINQTTEDFEIVQMQIAYMQCRELMICCLAFFSDIKKINKVMAIIIFVINLRFMFIYGQSRGPIICFAIFLLLFYLSRGITKRKIILVSSISVASFLIYINLYDILYFVQLKMEQFGISIGALDKTMYLLRVENSVGNGRERLYEGAIECIRSGSIFGRGIGFFEENFSGGIYVHQIFYQILCEFGIFGLICLVCILINSIIVFCKKENDESIRKIEVLLFSLAIPHLLFSSVYWQNTYFWMYLAWFINRKFKLQKIMVTTTVSEL